MADAAPVREAALPLLDAAALLRSDSVVNATMNRDRGLAGVNSYERDLKFAILSFLRAVVERQGGAVWYDACCGTGRALHEAARELARQEWGANVRLIGVDLWPQFAYPSSGNIRFIPADVTTFTLPDGDPLGRADLITCVHGVHYLGDKLRFLEVAFAQLRPGGMFLAHLDPVNLRLPEGHSWAKLLRAARSPTGGYPAPGIHYRGGILRMERSAASSEVLHFPLRFAGAVAPGTRNLSGMVGVDSVYEKE